MPYDENHGIPRETKEEQRERRARGVSAARALGLTSRTILPKCPCKSVSRARNLGAPHNEAGHSCQECRCIHTAGAGTSHYGVGPCHAHERAMGKKVAEKMIMAQAYAIQRGYPDKPFRYLDTSEYSAEIHSAAEKCKNVITVREELSVIQVQLQEILDAINGKRSFTESSKNGPVEASDGYKVTLLTKLTKAICDMVKLEFQVTDDKYIPIEQVMTWISAFIRIIEQKVPKELYAEIIDEVKKVPQPKPGRGK